jgi:hypothetical protein
MNARRVQEECKAVADEDKMRYQGEVQAWAHANPDLAQGLHKPKLPTKRGMNGYVLFMKDFQCGSPPSLLHSYTMQCDALLAAPIALSWLLQTVPRTHVPLCLNAVNLSIERFT